jgi:hypothetical protein
MFYARQTLSEAVTNVYYLIGCIIYQLYLTINSFFIHNQTSTALSTRVSSQYENTTSFTKNVNFTSTPTKNSNLNLMFLQNTIYNFSLLTPINRSLKTDTINSLNINSSFLNNLYRNILLPTTNLRLGTFTNSSYFDESKYILSTQLHPLFNQTLTTTTTLNDLYALQLQKNSDPMLSEIIPTGFNNIAKQQR